MAENAEAPFAPLKGARILDLSIYYPGPYLTRVLADLGAEVVKLESPGGDPARYMPPLVDGTGAGFRALNFGKQSIVVDLKDPHGKDVVLSLAEHADVVVETFRPGVLDRLGVGYEALRGRKVDTILCSVSGYGQDGELRDRAGHDLNYAARSGALSLGGLANDIPAMPGVQIADFVGGAMFGALSVLAALLERDRTGRGRHLDVSMTRGAVAATAFEAARRQVGPAEPAGDGMLTGGLPCYRLYRTRDGRAMSLGALEPKFFGAFCERAGVSHLSGDGYASGDRKRDVEAELEALFESKTQQQWVELLGDLDCCCEPVLQVEDVLARNDSGMETVGDGVNAFYRAPLGAPGAELSSEQVAELGADTHRVMADWGVPAGLVEQAKNSGALP